MPTCVGTAVGKCRFPSNQQTFQEQCGRRKGRHLEKSGKHAISQPALGL